MNDDTMPPSVGRIVHYVDAGGRCLAAIVTEVVASDVVHIAVFQPARADLRPVSWVTFSTAKTPSTWHWPERL